MHFFHWTSKAFAALSCIWITSFMQQRYLLSHVHGKLTCAFATHLEEQHRTLSPTQNSYNLALASQS
jgi:hypothetical protein